MTLSVVQVIPSITRVDGGPSEVVLQLHQQLCEIDDLQPTIVTTNRRMSGGDLDAMSREEVIVAKARPPARINFATGLIGPLRRAVRAADVVHIHSVDTYPSSIAAALCVRHNRPFVLQPHGSWDAYHRAQRQRSKHAYFSLFDKRAFAHAQAIVTSSDREALGAMTMVDRPTRVIPLGVDQSLLDVARTDSAAFTVLFLGRVTEKKGADVAIRAFAQSQLSRHGARLVVAGPLDPRLGYDPSSLARELGVSSAVDIVGPVDAAKRARLLSRSDVFILPSKDESFGVSVAEALAAGCAVLTTNEVGLAPAAAAEGVLVTAAADADAMSTALVRLWDDPVSRSHLADSGRAYAQREFGWPSVAAKFVDLYREVR